MSHARVSAMVNGEPTGVVDISDRGLQYGDGLFETIAVRHGQPRHWDRHLQRLRRGCARLAIAMPSIDRLNDEAQQMTAGLERAVLKLMVTRGGSLRGYRADAAATPSRLWQVFPWPAQPDSHAREGVRVCVCRTRLARQPGLAGVKHLNRLEQVLARAEWLQEYDEGLMLDSDDNVVEGVASNLFLFSHGTLMTPTLDHCGVEGITRERVLDAARQLGWSVRECRLRLDQLLAADEIFLTNTLIGIWPIRQIDAGTPAATSHAFAVGPQTRRLQEQIDHD